jgi:hypothetical protein
MNLTEPHCGTDLGLMRTKAEPQPDGTYRITGQKIFISAGDHDMAENIVHLVLAKIPGGPEGIKGVSLFIVPKFLVERRRQPRRAQRRLLRQDRGEDGHPRQFDLRDELRRGRRLPAGRSAQGHARDVHHDERGAARRRHAGRGAGRGRVPERARIRQGPAAGPRRDGAEEPRRPRRSADRAPRHPPQPDGAEELRRGRARLPALGLDADRPRAPGAATRMPTASSRS